MLENQGNALRHNFALFKECKNRVLIPSAAEKLQDGKLFSGII